LHHIFAQSAADTALNNENSLVYKGFTEKVYFSISNTFTIPACWNE